MEHVHHPECDGHVRKVYRSNVRDYIDEAVAGRDRDSCWIDWPFGFSNDRPRVRVCSRYVIVARYVFALTHKGRWPDGFACHHCDTPACWNPAHIYDGTPKQNQRDARERGRLARQPDGPFMRGPDYVEPPAAVRTTAPNGRLTDEGRTALIDAYNADPSRGVFARIARSHGVTESTVRRVVKRATDSAAV